MCDEFTAIEEEAALRRLAMGRREFGASGAAVLIAACSGGDSIAKSKEVTVVSEAVAIPTPDGVADGFLLRPERGKHPGVIMWPDVAGLREAYQQMARRLAASGYAVLVVNHYYRAGKAPFVTAMAEWRTPAGQEKLKAPIASLSPAGTVRDATAFVAWLDKNRYVDKRRKIGTQGYCQTGSFALRSAAALPERIGVAASFHGGGLVTAAPDSPHLLFGKMKAKALIAIARNDDARAPGDKDALRAAAAAAGRSADVEVEVYNADHGWCTIDAPIYDKAEADRAWARLLALYSKL